VEYDMRRRAAGLRESPKAMTYASFAATFRAAMYASFFWRFAA
jgi:hypothetical protein